MGSSVRAGSLLHDSDSEQLPVIDFSQNTKTSVCSDSAMTRPVSARSAGGNVFTVSSDSEEEEEEQEAFVPLAVRLKQKAVSKSTCESQKSSASQNGRLKEKKATARCVNVLEGDHGAVRPISEPVSVRDEDAEIRKRKRTLEEVEASRDEALRRKAEREKRHGERERLREEKKALTDAVKAMRPEECIKHMVVVVDPGLLQLEGGGDLLTSLHTMGCSCAIEKQPLPQSVSWVRRTACPQTGEVLSVPEALAVLQVSVEDFISMVHGSTQEKGRVGTKHHGVTLTAWVLRLMARNPDRTLGLAVIDVEKYFKNQNAKGRQKFRDTVLGEETKKRKRKDVEQLPDVSRVEMEEALVDLQLHTGVQVHFHSTWKDFTNYVTMSTKAVAEAPFKREREKTGFSFSLESEWAGGQKVERSGKGLLQVWKRQIQQLNRVSVDVATAILSAYPSPQLLVQAYGRCRSDREKATLLSDVLIRRGEGVTSTTRRIGPELSKRIFLLLTSSDPQQTLDSMA